MKQAFLILRGKQFISAAILSASILFTSFNAIANIHSPNKKEVIGKSNIQFNGSTGDGILITLHVSNESGADFQLTITGENDEVLYSRSYRDKDFNRQFKLLKDDYYGGNYHFIITSATKELEQTFHVNTTTRMVDEVAISKL